MSEYSHTIWPRDGDFVYVNKVEYAHLRELLAGQENQLAHYRRENDALYEAIDQARKALEIAVEALLKVTQMQEGQQ